jgi:hypothetical protein
LQPEAIPPEWYQQGLWPLVGAIAVLVVANIVSLWQVILQSRRSLSQQLRLRRMDFLSKQLSEFYDPLHSLMLTNQHVFENFGPQTFPVDNAKREVAAQTWNTLKEDVILPNNRQMASILRSRSHLTGTDDDITKYLDLNTHLVMYEVFHKQPTELYQKYHFPTDVAEHVGSVRGRLVDELARLSKS